MGHPEIDHTLERIQRIYYFPKMRKYVKNQIRKYTTYQKNKSAKHKLYKKLKTNTAPTGA
jgi:Integrase zinc binding domain